MAKPLLKGLPLRFAQTQIDYLPKQTPARCNYVETSGTNVCTLMEETLSFEINSCIILVYSLNTLHTLFAGR